MLPLVVLEQYYHIECRTVPIYIASLSFAKDESYSQLDKEALAIFFEVRKFHDFLYGRPFCIYSNHLPLQPSTSCSFGQCMSMVCLFSINVGKKNLFMMVVSFWEVVFAPKKGQESVVDLHN